MSTKTFRLRAFKIENNFVDKSSNNIYESLNDKLTTTVLNERRLLLNPDDPLKEEDLICDYDLQKSNQIWGAMLRISPSDTVLSLPDNLFDEKRIVIESLEELKGAGDVIYKSHYYFLLDNKFIITTLPGNMTIARFQTYLNWLLEDYRDNYFYEFTPCVTHQPRLKLRDMKTVLIQDPQYSDLIDEPKESESRSFLPIDFLKNLVNDVESLKEAKLSEIVSAELLLKFKKPKEMSKEDFQDTLGAMLKPVSDTDNIIFYPKKGKPIRGNEILMTEEVKIDKLESGKISEVQLKQEMEKFLYNLRSGYKN